jgi:putative phosphoesterase
VKNGRKTPSKTRTKISGNTPRKVSPKISRKASSTTRRKISGTAQAKTSGASRKIPAKAPTLIGLISDTHGLLREEALRALRGCELIIHAGDVGKPEILEALRQLAPVVAVRGNVDTAEWASALPATAVVEGAAATIYVLHDVHALDLNPVAAGLHIVVSGHSHKLGKSERDGVLYINPGSAGPRRFNLPITVARLDLSVTPWAVEFVDLEKMKLLR